MYVDDADTGSKYDMSINEEYEPKYEFNNDVDDLSSTDDVLSIDDDLSSSTSEIITKTNELDLDSDEYTSQFTKPKHGSVIYPNIDIPTNVEDYIDTQITESVTLYYCYFAIDTRSIKPFVLYGVHSVNKTPSQYYPEYLSEKQKDLSNNILSFLSTTIDLKKNPIFPLILSRMVFILDIFHTKPNQTIFIYCTK